MVFLFYHFLRIGEEFLGLKSLHNSHFLWNGNYIKLLYAHFLEYNINMMIIILILYIIYYFNNIILILYKKDNINMQINNEDEYNIFFLQRRFFIKEIRIKILRTISRNFTCKITILCVFFSQDFRQFLIASPDMLCTKNPKITILSF